MKLKKIGGMLLAAVFLFTAGCSSVFRVNQAYPVKIGDVDVVVGKTQVGALIDAGFQFYEVEFTDQEGGGKQRETYDIETDITLEADSYYETVYFTKDGKDYGAIDIVTDGKVVKLAESVIANIEISGEGIAHAAFDGVALSDLTREAAGEHVKGIESDDDSLFLRMKDYFVRMEYDGSRITRLQMEKSYDIDYGTTTAA